MVIAAGQPGHYFNQASITQNAPHASGVYALYHRGWVYFGESNDIQRRLSELLNEAGSAILRNAPTAFTFELVNGDAARIARQNVLIAMFPTPCNRRMD